VSNDWEWEDLIAYAEAQGNRDIPQDAPPWPEETNIMVKYLIQTAWIEMTEDLSVDSLTQTLIWLATHAWFEGGMAERSRIQKENDNG
jgi:hypothetical protein